MALRSLSQKIFSGQYLPSVIVLIPARIAMSQFVYKRQNDIGLGATVPEAVGPGRGLQIGLSGAGGR